MREPPLRSLPYPLVTIGLGLGLAWLPVLVHGPIPEKFDLLYLSGSIAVSGVYAARLLIGVWVGLTTWPAAFWLRGPLCGLLSMLPIGLFLLATPGCRHR